MVNYRSQIMSKETQPKSISRLQADITAIEQSTVRVTAAFDTLTPASFSKRLDDLSPLDTSRPEDMVYAIDRLGMARKKITEKSLPRLATLKEKTDRELTMRIGQVLQQLEDLRALKDQGYISAEELQEAERALSALGILKEESKPEMARVDEIAEISRISFLEGCEIEIDGKTVKLPSKEVQILRSLAKRIDQQVPARELCQEALDTDNTQKGRLSVYFNSLKSRIDPQGRLLVSSGRKANQSWYSLRNTQISWPFVSENDPPPQAPAAISPSRRRLPTAVRTTPIAKPERNLEEVRFQMRLGATRIIISHFSAKTMDSLSRYASDILNTAVNSQGIDLKDILNGDSDVERAHLLVEMVTDELERLWGKTDGNTAIENEIIKKCQVIQKRGTGPEKVIQYLCRHFGVEVPEKYAPRRKGKRIPDPSENKREGLPKHRKWNRQRPRKPNIPQHGGSLKRTILPIITRRAEEASGK